jgi:ATP-binding cassette, subfamily B (MDR/TAP), member 1
MAMFVQSFWFGAKLVRDGNIGTGDVVAVFWACLIATSNLQMSIPQFITLAKGKFAIVALLMLVQDSPSPPTPAPTISTPTSTSKYTLSSPSTRSLRKIIPLPKSCHGEFTLSSISFTYPSRPSLPVLSNISLYLPALELTFIVGSSGSGKSTVAQLLLNLYHPRTGTVLLDHSDLRYLDPGWVRENVCGVGQGMGDVVLEGKSILENVCLGVDGDVSRERVEEACRAAMLHEFVGGLEAGYETILGGTGGGGVALSGGQKQRLAIARARLRNPSVLILGRLFFPFVVFLTDIYFLDR